MGRIPGITGSWALALTMLFTPSIFLPEVRMSVFSATTKKFTTICYKVDGDKVILMGQVVHPTQKTDAETAVNQAELGLGRRGGFGIGQKPGQSQG